MNKYNLSLVAHAQLAVTLSDSGTSLQVMPGQGADFTPPPAIGVLARSRMYSDLEAAEHVKLISRSTDVFTIKREIIGTAQEWPAGTLLLGYWSPAVLEQQSENVDMLEFLANITVGAGKSDYVIISPNKDFDASAGSGLSVELTPGAAFASYKLFGKSTSTTLTFVAPATSTRYDLIQADPINQTISVKTGTEGGSAPSADSGCCPLWQVRTVVSQTTRISGDLTDVRPS